MKKSSHGLSIAERLDRLSVPEPMSGCVIWIGTRIWNGYERFHVSRSRHQVLAHRAAYEDATGRPLDPEVTLDHLCRNRACINWRHVEPVTQQENVLRGQGIAGRYARRTECNQGHPYTPENTATYQGARACRICHLARSRATKARLRLKKKELLDFHPSTSV